MKNQALRCLFWTALIGGSFAVHSLAQPDADVAFRQNARMGRGVNILSADPVWKSPDKGRMKERHFALIREAGFGNVRIPIHPFRFITDKEHFTLDPKFFTTLDWALKTALENGLMPIVDFHEYHEMSADPLGKKRMFLAVWRQIAVHCRDYPTEVLFEICNEPNIKPEIWNDLQEAARSLIRESNPQRTLVIGTINGNQIQHLKDLKLPDADRNIIVAIHYYQPIQFTHQGAPWSKKGRDQKDIPWTATNAEQAAVLRDFDSAQKWSKENNRPLTLGEFGAYEKADMKHRQIWTDFVARQAEQRNWSWSYWQFDSDFIAYDLDHDRWIMPIREALVPPPRIK
jgi:endoglucanase